ncbi:hypothetical protein VOLCADRAFT_86845 [Volvox carteri f. nagariensis]|uniref:Uncharacterized protein n=1 Tax=Volvox carteri f. nagariensis TaxID=3068 RepID=D8TJR9_VOLCA|nr:uncharacterized protein VOLCADRAFT_86845 [Volvox carteri f. nagariensis]EFJ52591.1 hypothetical protein VOLCADRAFT_86845 [Volvox carteri f. nagariensis]|eukprot:XP_002946664.1 hypothetical protein VOLCADRAFT_86845 [Volvox carteri f. nagariensis]
MLARDLMLSLLSGGKLLLELPDEPAAVSSLMTALGQAASKLRDVGLATALDPIYDPAAIAHGCGSTCYGNGSSAHTQPTPGYPNHHHHGNFGGGGGGSPSSSYDSPSSGGGATRRSHDSGGSVYVFCARAVPMPPAAANSADGTLAAAAATYTVGSSMGQEVLPVGPSVGVHTLLPALLRAVLRDGLVTLRCCWFDEELGTYSLWPDQMKGVAAGGGANGGATSGQEDCEDHEGCDAASLWSTSIGNSANAGPSGSAGVGAGPVVADAQAARLAAAAAAAAAATAGGLVRVPCVLRAIFKLDRQLRGLDLGGLVVLPHTFARSCRDSRTQVLHLDVVIAGSGNGIMGVTQRRTARTC